MPDASAPPLLTEAPRAGWPGVAASRRPSTWILALLALGHLVLAARHELVADEAYYWVWSRHLAAGYFDHPPAIAWLIAGGSALLEGELGVRLLPGLLGPLSLLPLLSLTPRPSSAALLLASTPLLALGGALATPDAPLCAAWALGLWAAAGERWVLLGLFAGLAMLSKYTGVLLLPLVVLAEPRALRGRGPWLAAAVATLVYAPNAAWNLQHDLVSWRFQLGHAAGTETTAGAGSLAFFLAQGLVLGPLTWLLGLCWLGLGLRPGGDRVDRLCWWTSAPLLLLAVGVGGEANWAAPAWIPVLLGLSRRGGRWPRLGAFAAGTSGLLSLLLALHLERPLVAIAGDPADRLHGGRILAESVASWGLQPVFTARYQEAALIHFYAGIPAHALPGHGRADQYELWPAPVDLDRPPPEHRRLLYVRPYRADSPVLLTRRGWDHDGANLVTTWAPGPSPDQDHPVESFQVYDLHWEGPGTALPEAPP